MKMENAQTENSAAGGASELTDVLERMRARADNAYCDYIGQLRRDECLGWEIKVERGKFGEAEMKAHCAAAEKLGRHRALHEAANMLAEVLRLTRHPSGRLRRRLIRVVRAQHLGQHGYENAQRRS
jgi:hypothetical protein